MPTKAKNIRIFLADGVPNGLMVAEIGNWVGKVLVVPRSANLIPTLAARKETAQTGLYVLSGPDITASVYREMVYIGESDNVLTRLSQHLTDPKKDFWERTVLIVSKDNNLTKAHVRYLEYRLINIAQQAGRATLANGNSGMFPNLPEGDIADMEAFLDEIQILLPVLGFPFAQPIPKVAPPPNPQLYEPPLYGDTPQFELVISGATGLPASPVFTLNTAGVIARAQEIDGEFIVFTGSQAKASVQSLDGGYKNLRDQLIKEGKLAPDPASGHLQFTADVPFKSTSAAAAVIAGHKKNGPDSWKIKGANQTYKDWQLAQSVLTPAPAKPD